MTGVVEVPFVDAEGFGRVIRTSPAGASYWQEYGESLAQRRDEIRAAVARVSAADAEAARTQTARTLAGAV